MSDPDPGAEPRSPREPGIGGGSSAGAPNVPDRIVLVGFMAAGKTSVGRALAERLGYRLVDLDREVERRAGRTIPEIFRREGEEAFRRLEAEVTRTLDPPPGTVVAAGGGWMARAELRDRWPDAVRVWLRVGPDAALERLRGDLASRPMLDPDAPRESLAALLEDRREDYGRAEVEVDTEGRSPSQVAEEIARRLSGTR